MSVGFVDELGKPGGAPDALDLASNQRLKPQDGSGMHVSIASEICGNGKPLRRRFDAKLASIGCQIQARYALKKKKNWSAPEARCAFLSAEPAIPMSATNLQFYPL